MHDFLKIMTIVKSHLVALSEKYGLTLQQVKVMYTLYENGIIATGCVAASMRCDASNVTGIVERLVAQKLIERHEAEEDRRTKQLVLTEKGRRIIASMLEELPQQIGFDDLNKQEIAALHSIALKIN